MRPPPRRPPTPSRLVFPRSEEIAGGRRGEQGSHRSAWTQMCREPRVALTTGRSRPRGLWSDPEAEHARRLALDVCTARYEAPVLNAVGRGVPFFVSGFLKTK